MARIYALILLLALLLPPLIAQPLQWLSYDVALSEAPKVRKLVYVYFYSETCTACRMMDKIFEDPQVSDALSRSLLPVRVNVAERPDLVTAYGVPGTPAHLFICPNGTPLGGALGYRDAKSFLELIDSAISAARQRCSGFDERGTASEVDGRSPALEFAAAILFSLLIGLSTPFSPCILPLLPIVYLLASKGGRRGPALFALGLFSLNAAMMALASGLFLAARAYAEPLSYSLLFIAGLLLLLDRLSSVLSRVASRVATRVSSRVKKANPLALGALAAAMWGPCAAPMAAAAFSLTAFAHGVAESVAIGLAFAAGLSATAYALALILRRVRVSAIRRRVLKGFNKLMGVLMVAAALLRALGLI